MRARPRIPAGRRPGTFDDGRTPIADRAVVKMHRHEIAVRAPEAEIGAFPFGDVDSVKLRRLRRPDAHPGAKWPFLGRRCNSELSGNPDCGIAISNEPALETAAVLR